MNHKKLLKQLLLPGIAGAALVFIFVGIVGGALGNPKPHNVPVGVIAPTAVLNQIEQGVEQNAPGVFEVKSYDTLEAAQADLGKQKIYGIIQPTQETLDITVTSATGEAPKQLVIQAFNGFAQSMHKQSNITDLAPQASNIGTSLVMMFLLLLTTAAALIGQTLLRREETQHFGIWLASTTIAASLVGIAGAGIAAILGEFQASFWGVALALTTSGLASALIIAMFNAIFGEKGLLLAALLLVPLGTATASVVVNYHFLPDFYRIIAPHMPSFATIDAIRQAAFLDNVNMATPYFVFGLWIFSSMAIISLAMLVHRYLARKK